jgi:PKD repeat protein
VIGTLFIKTYTKMKRNAMQLCLLTFFVLLGLKPFAQVAQSHAVPHRCLSDEVMQRMKTADPGLEMRIETMDAQISQRLLQSTGGMEKSGNVALTIPVVVYVVHEGGVENISDQQVVSQIDALNAYYASYGIQFCLAVKEGSTQLVTTPLPSGISSATPGIFHYQNSTLTNHDAAQQIPLMATSYLPSERYMRIWVVKRISSAEVPANMKINGYATLPPGGNPAYSGIVMAYDAFGDAATCGCTSLDPQTNAGKTLVHEVGHYLSLYHTFQGGCAGMSSANCSTQGDKVCDTPPVLGPSWGCPAGSNTCNESPTDLPDDINNFMDYSDETCQTHFTPGQKGRMLAAIALYRATLVSSDNHAYTGLNCNLNLLAHFKMSNYAPCIGNSVTFTGNNVSGATYEWDFGDGATAVGNPVSHTYTAAFNPAQVVMTITVGAESVSSIRSMYVNTCTPIHAGDGNWLFGDRQMVDFSSGAPVYSNAAFTNNTMNGSWFECNVNQSMPDGSLLFYTIGTELWDGNHQLVTNAAGGDHSSAVGGMSIPDPGDPNRFYLFFTQTIGPAKYRIVTNVGGGSISLGPIITMPDDPALGPVYATGEGVTAIASCNNNYWIIMKGSRATGPWKLIAYELSPAGIILHSEVPFTIGSRYTTIEASPNGKRIAVSSQTGTNRLITFDFDPYTGTFSSEYILSTEAQNSSWPFGLSFSNNSNLLYAYYEGSAQIVQFNMANPVPASTAQLVANVTNFAGTRTSLQRGPDDKIYVLRNGAPQLGVIHASDNLCTEAQPNACQYTDYGPTLQNTAPYCALPNMIDAKDGNVFPGEITYTITGCSNYQFFANVCGATYEWNFGDPASGAANTSTLRDPSHTFVAVGDPNRTVTVTAGGVTYTVNIRLGMEAVYAGPNYICLTTQPVGNYSMEVAPGNSIEWMAVGGTIIGLANQPDATVLWNTIAGSYVTGHITNPATGCTATVTFMVNDGCEPQPSCKCDLKPVFSYELDDKTCTYHFTGDFGGDECLKDVTYTWYFGDGSMYVGQNPAHDFPANGVYNVCLFVTANNAKDTCYARYCIDIQVDCNHAECECHMRPDFSPVIDANCRVSFDVRLDGESCLRDISYRWDYGDGTYAVGLGGYHVFTSPGTYTVCLTVRASNGESYCEETICREVTVDCRGEACSCNLKPSIKLEKNGCTYTFNGISGTTCADVIAYNWYINGSGPVTTQQLVYVFQEEGSYNICLHVVAMGSNGEICDKQVCGKLTVKGCGGEKSMEFVDEDGLAIEIFPNPTAGELFVRFEMPASGPVDVTVHSLDGKLLLSETHFVEAGDRELQLNLPKSAANGLVLVELQVGGQKITKKIVVDKQ